MSAYQCVFVLGGPGAGKGTQCGRIVEKFGYVHLSAGDLLRAERNSGSENGAMINEYIKKGEIVPVEVTVGLLKTAMDMACKSDGKHHFLIDGFPRNQDNLQGWAKVMDGHADVQCVLFFDCPDEVCMTRAMERGKTSGRADDNPESFKLRLNTYHKSTEPIINHYKEKGMVVTINSVPDPDTVFAEVEKVFSTMSK